MYSSYNTKTEYLQEAQEDFREDSIQSDLDYLDNRVDSLLNLLEELGKRTKPIRIERSVPSEVLTKAEKEKSPIGAMVNKEIYKVQRGIESLETILCELTI